MFMGAKVAIERFAVKRVEVFADAEQNMPTGGLQEFCTIHIFVGEQVKRSLSRQTHDICSFVSMPDTGTRVFASSKSARNIFRNAFGFARIILAGRIIVHLFGKSLLRIDRLTLVLLGIPPRHTDAQIKVVGDVVREIRLFQEDNLNFLSIGMKEGEDMGDGLEGFVGFLGFIFRNEVVPVFDQKVRKPVVIPMLNVGAARRHELSGILCPDVEIVGDKAWVDPLLLEVECQGRAARYERVRVLKEFLESREGEAIGRKEGFHGGAVKKNRRLFFQFLCYRGVQKGSYRNGKRGASPRTRDAPADVRCPRKTVPFVRSISRLRAE